MRLVTSGQLFYGVDFQYFFLLQLVITGKFIYAGNVKFFFNIRLALYVVTLKVILSDKVVVGRSTDIYSGNF